MVLHDRPSENFSSISERIRTIARDNPSRPAVEAGPFETLSYAELDRQASRIASRLIEEGAGPGALVGVCLDRSALLVPALLGVLKTGAAYLPLDHTYPKDRLDFMLRDSGATLALAGGGLLGQVPTAVTLLQMDELLLCQTPCPEIHIAPSSLAYVIYTSGSTGRPKGVELTHGGVTNLLDSFAVTPGMSADDRVLAITTLSFDIAVIEIWLPLVLGAAVVLATRRTAVDGAALARAIAEHDVTFVQATPATWRLLLEAGWRDGTGIKALSGGEPLTRELANALLRTGADLWNVYGPTEATVWSSVAHVTSTDGPIAIGRPIANTDMWVLDGSERPAPSGTVGELHIGGAGLARGYLNRPELTAEKFIPHPFDSSPDARLYRTGDLGRQLPDGQFECLGRVDHQLKIDGHRIEPGEIESVLAAHPGVKQAVVTAHLRGPGDARLVGYIIHGDNPPPDAADLQARARRVLPAHMVPSTFVALPAAPLTPNGKLDRKALPAPSWTRAAHTPLCSPRTALEAKLAAIWCDVLELSEVGVDDNFFEIGGRSRLGARVFARIEGEIGVRLPLATLFDAPTIAELARAVDSRAAAGAWPCLVAIRSTGSHTPFYCVHPVGGNVVSYGPLADGLGEDIPFYALQAAGLDGIRQPMSSVEQMAAEYIREIRRVQPTGPYNLGGASFGGLVAFEMALQLRASGDNVSVLALLDTDFPPVPSSALFRAAAHSTLFRHVIYPLLIRTRAHLKSLRRLGFRQYRAAVRGAPQTGRTTESRGAFMRILADVEAANLKGLARYMPRHYDGTLHYFRARDQTHAPDRRHLWADVASAVHVHEVPGTHFSMRREPHVRVLTAALRRLLIGSAHATEAGGGAPHSLQQPPHRDTPRPARNQPGATLYRPGRGAERESVHLRV